MGRTLFNSSPNIFPQTGENFIRYGSKILIEHILTGRNLSCSFNNYTHERSSHQRQVFCKDTSMDQFSLWIIVPVSSDDSFPIKAGDLVYSGSKIRLINAATKNFLHSHSLHTPPPPLSPSPSHQEFNQSLDWHEVTAFGYSEDIIEASDDNDHWIITLTKNSSENKMKTYHRCGPMESIQLIHLSTNYCLSSHFKDYISSDGQRNQQVYCGLERGVESEWRVLFIQSASVDEIPASLPSNQRIEKDSNASEMHTIQYGNRIILKHFHTQSRLHSHSLQYSHAGSSGEQQVTGFSGLYDENDFWILLPVDFTSIAPGTIITYGSHILLKHCHTNKYLFGDANHRPPRPRGFEVSCRDLNNLTNIPSSFIWIVEHPHEVVDRSSSGSDARNEHSEHSWRKTDTIVLRNLSTSAELGSSYWTFTVELDWQQYVVFLDHGPDVQIAHDNASRNRHNDDQHLEREVDANEPSNHNVTISLRTISNVSNELEHNTRNVTSGERIEHSHLTERNINSSNTNSGLNLENLIHEFDEIDSPSLEISDNDNGDDSDIDIDEINHDEHESIDSSGYEESHGSENDDRDIERIDVADELRSDPSSFSTCEYENDHETLSADENNGQHESSFDESDMATEESDDFVNNDADQMNDVINQSRTAQELTAAEFEDLFVSHLAPFSSLFMTRSERSKFYWTIQFSKAADLDLLPPPMDSLASSSYLEPSPPCYSI